MNADGAVLHVLEAEYHRMVAMYGEAGRLGGGGQVWNSSDWNGGYTDQHDEAIAYHDQWRRIAQRNYETENEQAGEHSERKNGDWAEKMGQNYSAVSTDDTDYEDGGEVDGSGAAAGRPVHTFNNSRFQNRIQYDEENDSYRYSVQYSGPFQQNMQISVRTEHGAEESFLSGTILPRRTTGTPCRERCTLRRTAGTHDTAKVRSSSVVHCDIIS